MSSLVKSILEERANLWEQAKAVLDRAEQDKRSSLSAEDEQQFQALSAQIDVLDGQRKAIEEGEKRASDAADALANIGVKQQRGNAGRGADVALADELRAFLRGTQMNAELRAEDSPWVDFDELRSEKRALSVGTATAGGNTVPRAFVKKLYEHMIEMSAVMSLGCEVFNTQGGETMDVPITTGHGTASLVAEGAQITGTDPAFGKRQLGAYKYGQIVNVTKELTEDEQVDLLGYVAKQAGWAVGNALGAHLITGDGSSKPAGALTSATLGVTGGTGVTGAFTGDNLIDLYFSIIGPYRSKPSCGWLFKDSSLATARKLKDTTGQYLWQPGLVAGVPDQILGKPVVTDPNMPAVGLNAKSVLFGDFNAYAVRLVRGVRFERSDDFKFDTDYVSFKTVVRGDGILLDQTGALKYFSGGAS